MSHQNVGKKVIINNFDIEGYIYDTVIKPLQLNPYKPETIIFKVKYLDKNGVIRQVDCYEEDIRFAGPASVME